MSAAKIRRLNPTGRSSVSSVLQVGWTMLAAARNAGPSKSAATAGVRPAVRVGRTLRWDPQQVREQLAAATREGRA
jgi:hypothetical protein